MNSDEYYMKLAYLEAENALEKNEIPVGAVIVLDDRIIARGHNLTQTLNDVTAHAEMQAITAASDYLGSKFLPDCTLYVTLEPCVMCAGAISWAQMGTLVYGAADPKKGYTHFSDSILHPKTKVRKGVLENICEELIKQFFLSKRGK
jgi:tRNA(adenine34) deaminase